MDKEERAHATVHAPSRILRSIPEATGRVSPGAFPGPSPGPFPGPSPGALTLCFGSSGLFPCLCGHLLKARMCSPPPLLNVFSLLGRPERLSPSPRLLPSVLEAPGREDSEAHGRRANAAAAAGSLDGCSQQEECEECPQLDLCLRSTGLRLEEAEQKECVRPSPTERSPSPRKSSKTGQKP